MAERYAAIRPFFDAHEADVVEPVRSIIARGRDYSAADLYDAQRQLRALGQQAAALWHGMDVLLVPTAPTHYTIAAMQADPVALNRNLGAYTNFVNLLDYAALSVPSSIRPDGLPFGITLIGPCGSDWQLAELGQRYHHAHRTHAGRHRPAAARAAADRPACAPRARSRWPWSARTCPGMPLNSQLSERGAVLLGAAETAPHYRFFALPGTVPPKPGLLRVADGTGARIALEVWEMPATQYGSFVALIPAPLGIGTLTLADGASVQGFVCEALRYRGRAGHHPLGGWRAYIALLKAQAA